MLIQLQLIGLDMEITDLTVDIGSNPQQGSESIKATVTTDREEDSVEETDFIDFVPVTTEFERPLKSLR